MPQLNNFFALKEPNNKINIRKKHPKVSKTCPRVSLYCPNGAKFPHLVISSTVQLLWGVAIGCNSGGDWPIADVTVEQAGSIALKATNGYAGAMTW